MVTSAELATILADLLQDEGGAVLDTRSRLLASLRERAPDEPRDVHLLMTAFDAGVPSRLREGGDEPLGEMEVGQETAQIVDGFGASPNHARRAVEIWAMALKRRPIPPQPLGPAADPTAAPAGLGLTAPLPAMTEEPAAESTLVDATGASPGAPAPTSPAPPEPRPVPSAGAAPVRPLPLPASAEAVLPGPSGSGRPSPLPGAAPAVQALPQATSPATARPLPPASGPPVQPLPLPGAATGVRALPQASGPATVKPLPSAQGPAPRPLPLPGAAPSVQALPLPSGPAPVQPMPLPGAIAAAANPPWVAVGLVAAAVAGGLWASGILNPGGSTPPPPAEVEEPAGAPASPAPGPGSSRTTDEGYPIVAVGASPPAIKAQPIDGDPNSLLFPFGLVSGGTSYTYQAAVAFPAGRDDGIGLIKVFKSGNEASTDQLSVKRSLDSVGNVFFLLTGRLKGTVTAPSVCLGVLAGKTRGRFDLTTGEASFCAYGADSIGLCDVKANLGCGNLVP